MDKAIRNHVAHSRTFRGSAVSGIPGIPGMETPRQEFMTSPPLSHRQLTRALPHPEGDSPRPDGELGTRKRVWAQGEEVAEVGDMGRLRASWGENLREAGIDASGRPLLIHARRWDVDIPVDPLHLGIRMKLMVEDDTDNPIRKKWYEKFLHDNSKRKRSPSPSARTPRPPSPLGDIGSPFPIFQNGSKHFMHGEVVATWGESDKRIETLPGEEPPPEPVIAKAHRLDIDVPLRGSPLRVKIMVEHDWGTMNQTFFDKVSKAQKRIEDASSSSPGPSSPRSPPASPEREVAPLEADCSESDIMPPASPLIPEGSADADWECASQRH